MTEYEELKNLVDIAFISPIETGGRLDVNEVIGYAPIKTPGTSLAMGNNSTNLQHSFESAKSDWLVNYIVYLCAVITRFKAYCGCGFVRRTDGRSTAFR